MIKFLIGVAVGAYFHAALTDAVNSFLNPSAK